MPAVLDASEDGMTSGLGIGTYAYISTLRAPGDSIRQDTVVKCRRPMTRLDLDVAEPLKIPVTFARKEWWL